MKSYKPGLSGDDPALKLLYRAARIISRYFDVELHGVEHIPDDGVLMVSNHALMGIDAWALMPELYHQTHRIPRGLALRSLFSMPGLSKVLREVGAARGDRQTARALLQSGEMVLTYPGGSRDSLKDQSERYQLKWEGRLGFSHVAIDTGSPVIPVAGIGPDDCFPVLTKRGLIPTPGMGNSRVSWSPVFLPLAKPVPFQFFVGAPLTPPKVSESASTHTRNEAARDFASDVRRDLTALIAEGLKRRQDHPPRSPAERFNPRRAARALRTGLKKR